jgi:hypothetical protein
MVLTDPVTELEKNSFFLHHFVLKANKAKPDPSPGEKRGFAMKAQGEGTAKILTIYVPLRPFKRGVI